jgi:hypothetical protein
MISDPVALHYILNSPQFKLGPVPENLVHLLYPKGSIMSVDRGMWSGTPKRLFIDSWRGL